MFECSWFRPGEPWVKVVRAGTVMGQVLQVGMSRLKPNSLRVSAAA